MDQKEKKGLPFEYTINIVSLIVEYNASFNFKIKAGIKKAKNQVETKTAFKYDIPGKKELPIREDLIVNCEMIPKDDNANIETNLSGIAFEDRICTFYLMVYTKTGFKAATYADVNITNFLLQNKKGTPFEVDFTKHPFAYLKLKIAILSAELVNEITQEEGLQQESSVYAGNSDKLPTTEPDSGVDLCRSKTEIPRETSGNSQTNAVPSLVKTNTISVPANSKSDGTNINRRVSTNEEDVFLLQENIRVLSKRIEDSENEKKKLTEIIDNLKESGKGGKNTNSKLLEEEIKEKDKTISFYKNKIEYFNEEIAQLTSIINDLKADKKKVFDEKTEVIKEQRIGIESLSSKVAQMERENLKKAKEVDEVKHQLTEKEELVATMKIKIKEYEDKMKKDKDANSKTIKDGEQQSRLKDEKIASLEKTIDNLTKKFSEENQNASNKEVEIINLTSQIDDLHKEISLNKVTFSQKYEMLKADYVLLEEKNKELTNQIISIKSQSSKEISESIATKQNDIDLKDSSIKEFQMEISRYKDDIETKKCQINSLEQEKENIFEKFKATEKKYKDDIITLRRKLDEKITELEKISDEKESQKFENEKLKNDLKNLETNQSSDEEFFIKINKLQTSFAENEKTYMEEKEKEIKGLKREIDGLNLQLKKASMSTDNHIKMLENENTFIKEENIHLRADLEHHKELRENSIKLERQSIEYDGQIAILKKTITEKEMENESLQSTNHELKGRMEALEQEVVETKHKMGDVLNEMSEMELQVLSSRGGANSDEKRDGKGEKGKSKKKK